MTAVFTRELISIARAREIVLADSAPLATETVALADAQGRTLGEYLRADEDLPPFASSAMDGFATQAGPATTLSVVGEARAGHPMTKALAEGEAARISTGAMVPPGCDAVVPVEQSEDLGTSVRVGDRAAGMNIRLAGEDVASGEQLLAPGTTLGAAELAVVAAVGKGTVECVRKPRVALLATGDELVQPGQKRAQGQITNSNSVALRAQTLEAGGEVIATELVRDERASTVDALDRGLSSADVVCVSGGVSVGEHDHVKTALTTLEVEPRFWGVKLKPGKPTWFGVRGSTLVFGLPGNPVSTMVTFHLFARPALRLLLGAQPNELRSVGAFDIDVDRNPAREQVIRSRLRLAPDGWHLEPTKEQGSHILSSMLDADALALVPAGEGTLRASERVEFEFLPGRYV